jgi:hypothetical protein
VAATAISFEIELPAVAQIEERIRTTYLACVADETVLGYAYAGARHEAGHLPTVRRRVEAALDSRSTAPYSEYYAGYDATRRSRGLHSLMEVAFLFTSRPDFSLFGIYEEVSNSSLLAQR